MNNQRNNTPPYFILPECIKTFRKDTVGGPHQIALTTIYTINMVAVIVFNTLLVIGICKTRKKNRFTNSNKLFLLLCTSDLLAGVVLMPLQIYFVNHVTDMSCLHTAVRAFWNAFPAILSGTNILVITLDRFLMMVKNEYHRKWFSDESHLLMFIVFVEIALSFGLALWYVFTTQSMDPRDSAVLFISLSFYQFIILSSVVILNIIMVRHVKDSKKGTTLTFTNHHNRAENILSRTVSLISLALIICYTPGTLAMGIGGFYALYSKDRDSLRKVTISLIYCILPTQINSSVNAIIYLSRNTRIQLYYRNICRGGDHHHSHTEAQETIDSLASHKGIGVLHNTKYGIKNNATTKEKQSYQHNGKGEMKTLENSCSLSSLSNYNHVKINAEGKDVA